MIFPPFSIPWTNTLAYFASSIETKKKVLYYWLTPGPRATPAVNWVTDGNVDAGSDVAVYGDNVGKAVDENGDEIKVGDGNGQVGDWTEEQQKSCKF